MPSNADSSDLRRSVYLLLTAAAVAICAAKVLGAENVFEPSRYKAPIAGGYGMEQDRNWPAARPDPTAMFSSNDRSRWATIRALVDNGTYAIGTRVADASDSKGYRDEGIVADEAYKSLDIVMNPETKVFYSSKPTLLPTILAGEYWLLKKAFGWSIIKDRWLVMPAIILTVNVLPFAVYLILLGRLLETTGKTDFGRLLTFSAAGFGTFLTTFSGTLNNHLPAAFCVLFAVYPFLKASSEGRDVGTLGYLSSGFFAGSAATLELPALAFLAGLWVPLLICRPRQAILYFLPAALLPIAGLFATNYAAIGSWWPAYSEFGGPWYNFEGSHWAKRGTPLAKGIDFAAEPKEVYAAHLLFGHHGWFSLTPIWLLSLGGLLLLAVRSASDYRKMLGSAGKGSPWTSPSLAAMTLLVSIVVMGFYILRTNNYGGSTSGPRWFFWLTPLWLLALPAGVDRLANWRLGRILAATLLFGSVFSVFYPAWNPWRTPWAMQIMEYMGWLKY